MRAPVAGLMTFSDPRDEVHTQMRPFVEAEMEKLTDKLQKAGLEVVSSPEVIRSKEAALKYAKLLISKEVEALIAHIPVWTYPNIVVLAVNTVQRPTITLAPISAKYPGFVGLLAAAGSLDQVGIYNERIVGSIEDEETLRRVVAFVRASSAVHRLRGQTYGVFGGRSLGMYTAVADLSQWQRIFGVDIEHMDQWMIVQEAEKIPKERVDDFIDWLKENLGCIEFDGQTLTEEKLERQVRSYLGTKDLVKKYGFDFVGIKCQPELSDGYVNQCLTPAFLSDPYDAEGAKEPIVTACEVDHDGALTMQMLKLVSGKPVLFMDVRHIDADKGVFIFANCGGMSTWYSKRSEDPKVNLSEVRLLPQVQGKAGGAATQFICAEGDVTLARLYRLKGIYHMAILKGRFLEAPRERLKETTWPWPHAFISLDIDPNAFIKRYGSNHIHGVHGDYVEELSYLCQILNIEVETFH